VNLLHPSTTGAPLVRSHYDESDVRRADPRNLPLPMQ